MRWASCQGCRMVDLDYMQSLLAKRIAQRKGVEARAEDNRLAHTTRHRQREAIVDEAAAGSDEDSHTSPRGVGRLEYYHGGVGIGSQHEAGEGAGENGAAIRRLVRGPIVRNGQRRAAGLVLMHGLPPIKTASRLPKFGSENDL